MLRIVLDQKADLSKNDVISRLCCLLELPCLNYGDLTQLMINDKREMIIPRKLWFEFREVMVKENDNDKLKKLQEKVNLS